MSPLPHRLQILIDEIEAYREHGLFREALIRCREASHLIGTLEDLPDQKRLACILAAWVKSIRSEAGEWNDSPGPFSMKRQDRARVRALFSRSDDPSVPNAEEKSYRTAEALYVFNQHGMAIAEFGKLLDVDQYRIKGAKGILLSLYKSCEFEIAVSQYRIWLRDPRFSIRELNQLRSFLEKIIQRKKLKTVLPPVPDRVEEPGSQGDTLENSNPETEDSLHQE
jgi:hypothetical protein